MLQTGLADHATTNTDLESFYDFFFFYATFSLNVELEKKKRHKF